MARKPSLSPTKIQTYLECAVKYRWIYVDRLGRYYQRARAPLSFGNTLHQVLHAFHEGGATASAEEVIEHLQKAWIPAGYESAAQENAYLAVGAQIVEAYHAAAVARPAAIETLWLEKTLRTDMGPFWLLGRVDRVDRHPDGSLEIVDYKSGRLTTSPEEVAGDLAISIYQLIVRRLYPGTRVFGTIYCLRSGESASAEMADADAETFAADVLALGQEILGRDYAQIEPVRIPACEDCDFRARCETFWKTLEGAPDP